MVDEKEVEKSFWLSRPDGWVVNRKIRWAIVTRYAPDVIY